MEEKRIIDDAKNGNSESFTLLYDRYYRKIYNYIRSSGAKNSDVDELVQLSFLKIYKNLKYFDEEKGNIYNFMVSNCNQTVSDFYKRKKSRKNIVEMVRLDDGSLNEDLVYDAELDLDKYNLSGAISKLTKEQKDAFILIYVKHLKYKEAAEKLGRTESSIKSLAYRARQVLQEEIAKENPEIGKRYGFTKIIKIALISAICFALIGGFAYAMFRWYREKVEKKTFTLSEVKEELPEADAEITREVACEKINEYLEILGIDDSVKNEELQLLNDFDLLRKCWTYKSDVCIIKIDSSTSKLLVYSCLDESKINLNYSYDEIINKLHLIDGYELYSDEERNGFRYIDYAKNYSGVFNLYQKVSVVIKDKYITTIGVLDFKYEDKEILISKEDAIRILNLKESEIAKVELVIDRVDVNKKDYNTENFDGVNDLMRLKLLYNSVNISKVWKVSTNKGIMYIIDTNNGEISTISVLEGEQSN